jgi:hypothetical protein
MKTEITFASSTPLTIPRDAHEIVFQQRNHGGYLLQYKQTERAEPAGVILITEQERTIETRIFFDNEGTEEARWVTTGDYEVKKPGIDPAEFTSHLHGAAK